VADPVVYNLAGLCKSQLGATRCASVALHDIRRGVPRGELPALAVYVSEEEITEERGGTARHDAVVALDYYFGPVEQGVLDDRWADCREAARLVSVAVRNGSHADWPTPIVPAPVPPQDPAPGTPVLELVTGLQGFRLNGKIRYGYFHPVAPGAGASYLGFRASLAVLHDDTTEPSDITDLGPLVGHLTLPAEGTLPAGELVEFQPLASP
jgi:hypothetical protein